MTSQTCIHHTCMDGSNFALKNDDSTRRAFIMKLLTVGCVDATQCRSLARQTINGRCNSDTIVCAVHQIINISLHVLRTGYWPKLHDFDVVVWHGIESNLERFRVAVLTPRHNGGVRRRVRVVLPEIHWSGWTWR